MAVDIGPRLREIRLERRTSLRNVAAAIGISPSLLSQVETGKTQPSVSTLYSLVSFYGVSLDAILTGENPKTSGGDGAGVRVEENATRRGSVLQHASDNPTIEMENGVTWELLASPPHADVEPLVVTYSPGASSSLDGKLTRHGGVEYAYVMEGELTLRLEFDTYIIRAHDSVCFDSSRPHLYENKSDRVARGIWFVAGRHSAEEALPNDASAIQTPIRSSMSSLMDGLRSTRP